MSSAVERIDSVFGSWRKLPGGGQPMHHGQHLKAQASSENALEYA